MFPDSRLSYEIPHKCKTHTHLLHVFFVQCCSDKELVPGFTSLVSLAFINLFKCSIESSSPTRSYFHFTFSIINQKRSKESDLAQKVEGTIRPSAEDRTSCLTNPVYSAGEFLIYAQVQKQHKHVEHNTAFCRHPSVTMPKLPEVVSKGTLSKGRRWQQTE